MQTSTAEIDVSTSKIVIKDSGMRDEFSTGAVRDGQSGKGRFDLLPYHAIERIAIIFEMGAKKYADRNWEKGIPTHRFADSAMRHGHKYIGMWRDEDHAAMAAWNWIALMQTEYWIKTGKLPPDLQTLPQPPSADLTGQKVTRGG